MSLRSIGIAWTLLLAPAAVADTCGTAGFKGTLNGLRLDRPVSGAVVAGFGMLMHPLLKVQRFHNGLDLAGPYGEPVLAAGKGRVTFAARKGEYGNLVSIDHGTGLVTAYGHLKNIAVKAGDCVEPGVVVGHLGSTGVSSRPQVHFEVVVNGNHVDPAPFIGSTHP